MSKKGRRRAMLGLALVVAVGLSGQRLAGAETTLEKIARTGTLTIGARTGSPPFGFINKNNEWVGFSIDLVEQAVMPVIARRLGRPIRLEKKESTPATRIPLLTANAVDLIAETMTDTPERRERVDFSLTFFLTGAQFLVPKGSPITGLDTIAARRVGAQKGSTNARIIREKVPTAQLREFPDQPAAFQALVQEQIDAYTNDGIQLAGIKVKAPNPAAWEIVGAFYSSEPYGMAMRKNEPEFRALVNAGLRQAIESGKYFELYEKWFGPKGEVPYPMTPEIRKFIGSQK